MLNSIFTREIGLKKIHNNTSSKCDISIFLEQFESRSCDEYIVVGEEDGSSVPPLACGYCRVKSAGHILSLVDENGYFVLYNTRKTGPQAVIKEWLAHSNAIFDLSWMEEEEKVVTASGDQTAVLWDAPRGEMLDVFKGHTSTVRSISFRKQDNAVFATGSRDGHAMVWDKRCAKKDGHIPPVNIIRNAHTISAQQAAKQRKKSKLGPSLDSQQSVTVVLFQSDMHLVTAGAADGCVKVWDLRKTYSTMTDPLPWRSFHYSGTSKMKHGYSSLIFDSTYSRLFANCTDDIIYMYDFATYSSKPVRTFRGHKNSTFYVRSSISPDNQFLLSGSSDEMAYVWQIDKPNRSPVVLKGHRAEVTDVCWSPHDLTQLTTLSDDNTMHLWHLTRRVEPAAHGELTGTSEKTHREIGISASPVHSECPDATVPSNSSTSIQAVTPKQTKTAVSRLSTCSPKLISPSLKQWFQKNDSGVSNDLKEKTTLQKTCSDISNQENTMLQSANVKTFNVSLGKNKKPCKRRLVEDDGESKETKNPSKRQHILEDMASDINTSHVKETNIQDSELQSQLFSPDKLSGIPASLQSQFMSPKSSKFDSNSILRQSPTVNLPNSVFETPPRHMKRHRRDIESNQTTPKMDWLTKIRLEKFRLGNSPSSRRKLNSPYRQTQTPSDFGSPSSTCSQRSEDIGVQYNPESLQFSQSPVRGVKSIMSYFQPLPLTQELED